MKQRYLRLSILGWLLGSFLIQTSCNGQGTDYQVSDDHMIITKAKVYDGIPSIQDSTTDKENLIEVYSDSNRKLSFQYPKDWVVTTANQQNLKGKVTVYTWSIENPQKDSLLQFNLHLPPLGEQLYLGIKNEVGQIGFDTLMVNNLPWIIQTKIQRKNGKGNALRINQSITTAYCFISKSQELMEIIFKIPESDKQKAGDFIRDFILNINLNH